MNSLLVRLALLAALVIGALPIFAAPAHAYSLYLCSQLRSGSAPATRWTAPASGTSYNLDARGCGLISAADLGDANASGFVAQSPARSVVAKGMSSGTTQVTIPAGVQIDRILIEEDSGGTVVGLRIGTAANATNILSASVVPANSVTSTDSTSIGLRHFPRSGPTTAYITAGTWASSQINVTIFYQYY
jgi:hypothetical protein